MYKVFYNPKTLEIKGYSKQKDAMNFPYVETIIEPGFLCNYEIKNGKLKCKKMQFTDKEWNNMFKD